MVTVLWTGQSTNPTTGNIAQGFIGSSWDEAKASCVGCDYAPAKWNKDNDGDGGDGGCYFWEGSAWMGFTAMVRSFNNGKDKSIEAAIESSSRQANYGRLGAGGDPSALTKEEVEDIRAKFRNERMGLLGYTHFAEGRGAHLKGLMMASCDWDYEKADRVVDSGWRATVTVPEDVMDWTPEQREKLRTPGGRRIKLCPNKMEKTITTRRGEFLVTCNDCGWCDAEEAGPEVVGFAEHGKAKRLQPQRKISRMSKLGVAIAS